MADNRDIIDQIDALITAVYRDRILNPWDAGRARAAEFERLFRKRLATWPLRNLTDPVYGGSTAIAFLLHPGHYIGVPTRDGIEVLISRLGGQCYHALVEISHLGPFARVRFTRESLENESGGISYSEQNDPYRAEDTEFLSSLENFFDEEQIQILSQEVLHHRVPDVELDVTEAGCATIYHCLFDEE